MADGVLALLCAVAAEERILRHLAGPGVRVIVTGMGSGPAEHHAARAIAAGATAMIAVGFCGALDPTLARGDVVIPERVIDAATGDQFICDSGLTRGAGVSSGTLTTTPNVVSHPAARAELVGIAVDMESAGVARACARAGIPFAAIRAVTDRADDILPNLNGLIAPSGDIHRLRIVRRVVTRPSEIAVWTRLARGARVARRGLVPAVAAALAGVA